MLRITETVFNRLQKNRENCILQCRKHYARMKLSHWALHLMLCLKSECFHFAHCHQLSWCHFRACRRLFAWGLPGTFLVQQWEIPACSMLLSCRRVRSLTPRWPQHKKTPEMGAKGKRRKGEMVNASVRDVCLLQSGAVILFKGWYSFQSCLSAQVKEISGGFCVPMVLSNGEQPARMGVSLLLCCRATCLPRDLCTPAASQGCAGPRRAVCGIDFIFL